ncbi:MAG: hypothetical protein Q8Q25_03075, partial [bacterium]|nr:hypothetical protein [bacterium]
MLPKTIKRYISLPLFSVLFIGHIFVGLMGTRTAYAMTTPAKPATGTPRAGIPELSQQEIEDMQKQMEEISKLTPEEQADLLMEEIGKLPPEEQEKIKHMAAKIETAMAEVGEDTLNNMSEDDLMKFFDDIFTEEAKNQEPKQEISAPKEVETKPVQKVTSEQEKLLETIHALINRIEAFLVKVNTIPELPEKTKKWIKNGKLSEWPKDFTWDKIKTKIESFNQKLYKAIATDPKTKEYRFLPELSKDEALRNNLTNLQNKLVQYEPQIEVSTFGLKKLGKKVKQATQKVLNTLGESTHKLTIIESFDKVFEKYEPEAKKIREKEESALKKAEEEAKKPKTPVRATSSRQSEDNGYYAPTSDYGYPSSGYGYQPSSDYGYSSPGYGAPTRGETPSATSEKPSTRAQTTKPNGKATTIDTKKDEKKAGKEESTYISPQVDPMTQKLEKISNKVKKAAKKIQESNSLLDIRKHLTDDDADVNVLKANQQILKEATDLLKDATQNVEVLQETLKPLKEDRKKYYKNEVENRIKADRGVIKSVVDQIDAIQKEWDTLKDRVDDYKKYAYLHEELPAVRAPEGAEKHKAIQEQIP